MNEVEVKIIGINPAEIRKKLLALGAKRTFKGRLEVKAFDFPDWKLGKQGGHLRLRKVGKKVELTYKQKLKSKRFKRRLEIETHVEDFDSMLKILKKLGLREVNKYNKTRESYKLGNINFDIDVNPKSTNIPPLVEVESTEEGVKKGVRLLGFQMKDTSTASAWGLLDYYKKK
jgi:predicted adenylyl cyclase CyaB